MNQELGLYRCWGCQVRGDVITFVREVEHLDFVGAVELLAGWAGITLRYSDKGEGETRKRRARLVKAVEQAVDWYHERLLSAPDAAVARKYLRERGLSGDEVRAFRIGWAPDEWQALVRALKLPDDVIRDTGPRLPQPQRPADRCVPGTDPVPDLRRQRRRRRLRGTGDARGRGPEVQEHAGDRCCTRSRSSSTP